MNNHGRDFEYDVVLSFAGEDRGYVEAVAECLKGWGLKVFYDKYEQIDLWGKDLYVHLDTVYREKARFCIMFISRYYKDKLWTNHERESAQARAFEEHKEYILPARFDNTKIPGLRETIGYIPLKNYTPSQFAELVVKKVGLPIPEKFLPSDLTSLLKFMGARSKKDRLAVQQIAEHLLSELILMKDNELRFIYNLFLQGCPAELPNNIHINLVHLERVTGMTRAKIEELIEDLESFGFSATIKRDKGHSWAGRRALKGYRLEMEVHDRHVDPPLDNVTAVLAAMIDVLNEWLCPECAEKAFLRLDFTVLK